jgi:serine/threonine-protein kinase
LTEPTRLGKYEITGVLGKGAMGVVYAALDPRLGRKVAIKTVLTGHLEDEATRQEYSARFEREARAVAKLNHPNIVNVYDFGEAADLAYLVMEYLQGHELKTLLDPGRPLPTERWWRVMQGLLGALAHAHAHGVVHRDIKPSNVMLLADGGLKLMDFGVARLQDAGDETQVGTRIGTLAYMAPEQLQGLAVDHRIDIFAAGVVLYQCLTGRKPFTGNEWEIQRKIMFEAAPPPSQSQPGLTPALDAVLARAMAKAPEDRFAQAADFLAALQQAVLGLAEVTSPGATPGEAATDEDATRVLGRQGADTWPGGTSTGRVAVPTAGPDLFGVVPGDETGVMDRGRTTPGGAPPGRAAPPATATGRPPVAKLGVAAAVLLLLGAGAWWALRPAPPSPTSPASPPSASAPVAPAPTPAPVPAAVPEPAPPAAPRFGLTLATPSGQQRFAEGEALALVVKPEAPAHLYCFMQDEKGEVLRFFPNRFKTDARVGPAGIELPGGMKFRILASFKGRNEAVECLAFAQALPASAPLVQAGDFKSLPVADLDAVRAALEQAGGPALAVQRLEVLPKP